MQVKIIPAVISVVVIIALIFVVKLIFLTEPATDYIEPETHVEQPRIIRDTAAPVIPQTEYPASTDPIAIVEESIPEPSIVSAPLTLNDSDAQVLLAAADFAPALAQWLIPAQQLRKWVLAIDLMADGKLPMRYRPLDYPMSKFNVSQEETTVPAASNYPRMQAIISTVTSIDAQHLVRYYRQWSPILEKAYREQGKPDTFDQRLRQAISHVLAGEALRGDPALMRPSVLYRYADESLEQASDVDKLLWRMGPDNREQLQHFVRELRYQLDEPS